MRRFAILTAVAAVMTLSSTARADDLFECSIKQLNINGGWLPEVVAVLRKTGEDTATVNDPIIQYFLGAPIEAKVETDNARRTTFTWEVAAKSPTGQYARFSYRLTVMKADLAASMAGSPGGFDNNFTATGTCKRSKG